MESKQTVEELMKDACLQDQMTEATVEAELALAGALQQYAEVAGLSEWAGQVIRAGNASWFGGVELRPAMNTTAVASMHVQLMEPGLDRVEVCFRLTWSAVEPMITGSLHRMYQHLHTP
jgi:hypothetical protein